MIKWLWLRWEMFRKIILGYTYSPSLGDKLLKYEEELRKKLRWRIADIFLIIFALFSICFSSLFPFNTQTKPSPIAKIESTKEIQLSSKLVYAPDTAQENSEILVELRAKNISDTTQTAYFEFQSSDILEYAEILPQKDLHIRDDFSSFSPVQIPPKSEEVRKIVIKIKNRIPALSQNKTTPNSYDCQISLFFGNLTSQKITCSPFRALDIINFADNYISDNIVIWLLSLLLFTSIISTFRTNLLLKQIKIIRRKS